MIISDDIEKLRLSIEELRQDIEHLDQGKCNYNIGANLLSIKERFLNEISIRVFYIVCIVEGVLKVISS